MTVAGHGQGMGEGIALLDEDLVSNTSTGRVEVDSVLASKSLDGSVFLEVLGCLILHIMVQSKDRLCRVKDLGSTY